MKKSKRIITPDIDKILVAFAIHERLYYPKIKEIYLISTPGERKVALEAMQQTIKLKYNNSKAYAQFIKNPLNKAKNDVTRSSRTQQN